MCAQICPRVRFLSPGVRRANKQESGMVAVEFLAVIPVALLLLMVILEGSVLYTTDKALGEAAQSAATYLSSDPTLTQAEVKSFITDTYATQLNPSQLNVRSSIADKTTEHYDHQMWSEANGNFIARPSVFSFAWGNVQLDYEYHWLTPVARFAAQAVQPGTITLGATSSSLINLSTAESW